jgi:hypothetical protein
MNREQEHNDLLKELSNIPSVMDDMLSKAFEREKRRNIIRNRIAIPLSTAAAICIIFTSIVNISPAFASAMEHVPVLRTLAEAVSFSPSLSTVVEHDFLQTERQEQTIEDALTIRLEYVIVDGDQLHIFYTMHSLIDTNFGLGFGGYGTDENHETFIPIRGVGTMDPQPWEQREDGEFHSITLSFDGPVPPVVIWGGGVRDTGADDVFPGRNIGEYSFTIVIDDALTGQKFIDVYQDFIIEDQRFTITTVVLNPAHTRVNIETDWENNTELLRQLYFYMINERGEQFNPRTAGYVSLPAGGTGYDGPWRIEDHFLETAFFTENENLSLVITGVEWLVDEWSGLRADVIHLDEPIIIQVK